MNKKHQKKFRITGMTCTSCEVTVERSFKKISGVEKVEVHHATGECIVEYNGDHQPDLPSLQKTLQGKEYSIHEWDERVPFQKRDWKEIIIAVIGVFFLYPIFKSIGVFSGTVGAGTDSLTYSAVFLVGIVAALSSCTAVVGGLILSFSANYAKVHPDATGAQRLKPHLFFNVGRIASYFLLGGLVGLLGGVITPSPRFSGLLTILIAVVMFFLAVDILQLFRASRYIPRMPKFFSHKLHAMAEKDNPYLAIAAGALTFFLPCGFTQSMQLYALTTGTFWGGALIMFTFALGTLPALLGVGMIASFSKGTFARYFMKFSGVLVLLFSVYTLNSGFNLLGVSLKTFVSGSSSVTTTADATVSGKKQIVNMAVQKTDYVPSTITIQKGVPVEWHVDGSGAIGCTSILTIPSLGINKTLKRSGDNVITFTPQKTGNLHFTCGMGMASGDFVVVDTLPKQQKGVTACDPSIQECRI